MEGVLPLVYVGIRVTVPPSQFSVEHVKMNMDENLYRQGAGVSHPKVFLVPSLVSRRLGNFPHQGIPLQMPETISSLGIYRKMLRRLILSIIVPLLIVP